MATIEGARFRYVLPRDSRFPLWVQKVEYEECDVPRGPMLMAHTGRQKRRIVYISWSIFLRSVVVSCSFVSLPAIYLRLHFRYMYPSMSSTNN